MIFSAKLSAMKTYEQVTIYKLMFSNIHIHISMLILICIYIITIIKRRDMTVKENLEWYHMERFGRKKVKI